MLSYKKILLLIVFGLANQQLLVSIEVSKRKITLNRRDFERILKESQLQMQLEIAAEEAKKEQEQEEKRKQEEQEELAKLQQWIDAPLNPSFGDLSGEDLVRLQDVFAGTPDNSTDLPGSLSQMSAQDVLRLQQEREAQEAADAQLAAQLQRAQELAADGSSTAALSKKMWLRLLMSKINLLKWQADNRHLQEVMIK
jgi:Skp family chaperone for outer membrane proteins